MNVMVRRHHGHQPLSQPRPNQCRAVCDRDRSAAPIGFEQQVFARYLAPDRDAEDLFQIGRHKDKDTLWGNQRGQTCDSVVEEAGTSVEAEQRLGTISAGGRPKACAKAAGDDQRRSAITKRARRWPVQSPPSSLSLVSNRRRISPIRVSSFASKRNTSAGWVLEARTSPHPSGKFTRTPSISVTS